MKKLILLVAIATLGLACKKDSETKKTPKSTEKVLLRLNYEKGTELMLSFDMETKADQGVSVSEQIGLDIKVADVSADANPVYRFEGKVAYIKMDSRMMGQNDYYDSSKKEENMTSEELEWHNEFKSILHKPMAFSIDSKGAIVKTFEFADGVRTAMEQPIELHNYQIVFPEKEVGIGDSWTGEYANPLTNTMVKNTYTLTDISPEMVVVKVESLVPGIKGVMKENTLEGSYTIDRKTGMLVEGIMQGTMNQMNAKVKYTFTTSKIK